VRYRVIASLDQEMNVISHENICIKNKAAFVSVSVESLKVLAAVGFIEKDMMW
jgi:hypothetical protein